MNVVWKLKQASVKEVTEILNRDEDVAYNTVQTMLGILTDKGYVSRHKSGRAFVYQPLVQRAEASRSALKHLMKQFFSGSPAALVSNLMESDEVDPMEIERLKRIIDDSAEG